MVDKENRKDPSLLFYWILFGFLIAGSVSIISQPSDPALIACGSLAVTVFIGYVLARRNNQKYEERLSEERDLVERAKAGDVLQPYAIVEPDGSVQGVVLHDMERSLRERYHGFKNRGSIASKLSMFSLSPLVVQFFYILLNKIIDFGLVYIFIEALVISLVFYVFNEVKLFETLRVLNELFGYSREGDPELRKSKY